MVGRISEAVSGLIKSYTEETQKIAGAEMKLAKLSKEETEAISDMLDKLLYTNANESIRQLYAENFEAIVDLVRVVKSETKQDFAGIRAKGNQLTLVDLTADVFARVWGTTGKTDFTYTATTVGATDYLGTSTNPEATSEEEGIIILGFIEAATSPKINKTQFIKNRESFITNNLKFDADETFYVAPLVEPWFIPPESTFNVRMNFYKTGKTELIPIGVKVLQAKNIANL